VSERHEKDFYETPAWVTSALLEHAAGICAAERILEPCAGNGAILHEMQGRWGMRNSKYTAVEIREEARDELEYHTDEVHIADFLTWQPTGEYDLIITNPPFSIAQQIMERCFEIADGKATFAMLLPLSFMGADKRYDFWQKHTPSDLYVISHRPSFTGGSGTDNAVYGWFVWRPDCLDQVIRVVDSQFRPGREVSQ
jgi:hypothetical protein